MLGLLPFLVVKKEQAIEALKFSKTVYKRGKQKVSDEEKQIREECMKNIKDLKRQEWIQGRQLLEDWNN